MVSTAMVSASSFRLCQVGPQDRFISAGIDVDPQPAPRGCRGENTPQLARHRLGFVGLDEDLESFLELALADHRHDLYRTQDPRSGRSGHPRGSLDEPLPAGAVASRLDELHERWIAEFPALLELSLKPEAVVRPNHGLNRVVPRLR